MPRRVLKGPGGTEPAVQRYVVGMESELPPGSRRIISVGTHGIGVFNVNGTYYALKNVCPHQGGPLCLGSLEGTAISVAGPDGGDRIAWVREGEILCCPWHRWEFDISTGKPLFPSKMRVATYKVTVETSPSEPSVETYSVSVEDGVVIVEAP
jgi:nitrite reductase (NADH) small subunit